MPSELNAGLWKNYIIDTLKNATKTFDNKLGNDAVQGFYRAVNGNDVAVYLYKEGAILGRVIDGVANNGLKFRGYIDKVTGEITNFFPIFE